MDVQLDLSMRTAGILKGCSLTDYQSEYEEILETLSTELWCLRHDWMGAYSGPISVLVPLALIAQ